MNNNSKHNRQEIEKRKLASKISKNKNMNLYLKNKQVIRH